LWSYDSRASGDLAIPPLAGDAWQIRRKSIETGQTSRAGAPPLYVVRHRHFPARLVFMDSFYTGGIL